jgi:pantothenate synthetase
VTVLADLEDVGRRVLTHPGLELDYLAIVDAETLEPARTNSRSCRVVLAAEIDGVRLIDNIALARHPDEVEGDAAA